MTTIEFGRSKGRLSRLTDGDPLICLWRSPDFAGVRALGMFQADLRKVGGKYDKPSCSPEKHWYTFRVGTWRASIGLLERTQ